MKWNPPHVPRTIPQGDMPGDQIHIGPNHIEKANIICPNLLEALRNSNHPYFVAAVCGGSGVGKSETASLLAYYLQKAGIGSYTLSGDNYPHRIPRDNDLERLRVFRVNGIKGLVANGQYSEERKRLLKQWQLEDKDADPALVNDNPWMAIYQREGRKALSGYLGSSLEIDFDEVTQIISQFKNGTSSIWLKRMGREKTELWYDGVDFSYVQVLIIEWTHGNSPWFQGVDYPILLNSTPKETLGYRKSRHRDGGVDSPFTTMVLELEQKQLEQQADRAKLIIAKDGSVLSYGEYRQLMAGQGE